MLHEVRWCGGPLWRGRLGVAVLVAVLSTHACTPRTSRTSDDELVVVVDSAMKTADPRFALTNNDSKLSKLVAPGLTAVDTLDGAPRLELASAIEARDALTWDVTLRENARFSDGAPVEARDVVWTFSSVLAPESKSLFAKNLRERFIAVTALNSRTVRFVLRKPLATLWSDLDFGILAASQAEPDGSLRGAAPIGAGPYRLEALNADCARLVANPHYWRGAPRVPRLRFQFVPDAGARVLMLAGGSADIVQNGVRLDVLDDVAHRERVRVSSGPSVLLTYLMFNTDDPVLHDVRVRQAIALALDRERLIAAKFAGRAVLATGLLPPTHWAYATDVVRWSRDLARAHALLDAAGLRDPDGPAGPLPRLRLVYKTSSDAFRVSLARLIAEQLGAVGIAVDVRPFEFATFFADIKKGNFQIASMQTSDISEPDYYYAYFHSSRIPSAANPDGGNRWRYRDADIDAWTEAGRAEMDTAVRRQLYAQVQRRLAETLPIVPLWHEDNVVVMNRRVAGYALSPNARFAALPLVTK